MRALAPLFLLALMPGIAAAQDYPRVLPTPGGEVVIANERWQREHDEIGYAQTRRMGDTLYVSGVIVFRAEGEGNDKAAFEAQVRRGLQRLNGALEANGATFNDVAMMNSFHVWEGPNFTGTRMEQIEAISKVWREFSDGPRPAWTAVGTTGLLGETGIIEIQLIAYAPPKA
jgi:enamine deaminase RidA (YjgF/YER057c/UK114 family)